MNRSFPFFPPALTLHPHVPLSSFLGWEFEAFSEPLFPPPIPSSSGDIKGGTFPVKSMSIFPLRHSRCWSRLWTGWLLASRESSSDPGVQALLSIMGCFSQVNPAAVSDPLVLAVAVQ